MGLCTDSLGWSRHGAQGAPTQAASPSPPPETRGCSSGTEEGCLEELGFTAHPLPEPPRHPQEQEMLFWVNEPHQTLMSDSW